MFKNFFIHTVYNIVFPINFQQNRLFSEQSQLKTACQEKLTVSTKANTSVMDSNYYTKTTKNENQFT